MASCTYSVRPLVHSGKVLLMSEPRRATVKSRPMTPNIGLLEVRDRNLQLRNMKAYIDYQARVISFKNYFGRDLLYPIIYTPHYSNRVYVERLLINLTYQCKCFPLLIFVVSVLKLVGFSRLLFLTVYIILMHTICHIQLKNNNQFTVPISNTVFKPLFAILNRDRFRFSISLSIQRLV